MQKGVCNLTDIDKRDFNLAAKTWDDNPMRIELAGALANAILSRIPVANTMDMLDYGAGTGLVTLGLQPYMRSVVAAWWQRTALKVCWTDWMRR